MKKLFTITAGSDNYLFSGGYGITTNREIADQFNEAEAKEICAELNLVESEAMEEIK